MSTTYDIGYYLGTKLKHLSDLLDGLEGRATALEEAEPESEGVTYLKAQAREMNSTDMVYVYIPISMTSSYSSMYNIYNVDIYFPSVSSVRTTWASRVETEDGVYNRFGYNANQVSGRPFEKASFIRLDCSGGQKTIRCTVPYMYKDTASNNAYYIFEEYIPEY
ncbi:MAG: hypothetical protein E7069_03550 [Bacteroidales bacterium]|nr:hypothetical protein [Bacteroidales bacterium]